MSRFQADPTDLSFTYFPESYRWSHGLLLGLSASPWGGGEIGEIHRIGLRLQSKLGDDKAWFREWSDEADRIEKIGRGLLKSGHSASGAKYLFRAANYYHVGERFLQPKSDGLEAYKRGVDCFRDAGVVSDHLNIEHVEIPFEGTTLPALLVLPGARGTKPNRIPALVFFDGFDVTKEIQYFKGVPDLVVRGIGCLIVDGPGNGEAVRFRNQYLRHDTESYGTAAYEYLANRPEVDPARIGVMGISLGGYYAPRAAALEPRFAASIAWGAQWDYEDTWRKRFERIDKNAATSLSVPWEHLLWILNVKTRDEALKKLANFKLEGVVQKVKCPFLLVHGEGDEQISLDLAKLCLSKVGSANKTLKVFTKEEGGYHHCQIDNTSIAMAYMWDWLEDVLKGSAPGGKG